MGELLDKATAFGAKLAGAPPPGTEAPQEEPAPKLAPDQALRDPETGLVAVTNADGSTDFVRQEDAAAALAQGSRPASEAEYYSAKGGTLGKVGSLGVGALQGLTFDFAAPAAVAAAKAIGDEEDVAHARRALRVAQTANPGSYVGGEVIGSLAGAYAMPGGGAAKGVQGGSMLARGLSRAAEAAPRAALEGLGFGVGHQLTEDALGDHEANAQKLLASAEGGAIFGALLGGGFAAGGGALGDVARGLLGRTASKGARAAEGAAETEAYRAAGAGRTEESGGALAWLREHAEEQAFKSTGAKTGDIRKLGANGEVQADEMKRIGRTLLDEGLVGPTTSKSEMAERVEERLKKAATDLDEMRKPLDKASVRPLMQNIVGEFEQKVVQPLTGRTIAELEAGLLPNAGGLYGDLEVKPALDALQRLQARAGDAPNFEKLHDLRVDLDAVLKKSYARGPGPIPPGEEGLRTLRSIVEDEYTRAGEEAAKELGGTLESKYRVAKGLYGDLKTVQSILAREVPREASNRAISLTDTIAGAGGLGAAATALASGHPVGALAAAAPLVNKAIRTYGNQAAAFVLNKASQLESIQRVAAKFDASVKEGAIAFFKGGAKTSATSSAPKAKVTAETAQKIRAAVANPSALRAHVEDVVAESGLRDNAPNTAQALATTVMRAATYLAAKAPVDPPRQSISFVPQPPRPVSATDMQRFQDIVDAVNDPQSVIEDLKKGRLNRDKIDALRNVYPQIYDKVRAEVASVAFGLKPSLTDQQEIALSVLTGEPINAMMRPSNIRGFTQAFALGADPSQTGQASGQPAPNAPRRPLTKQGGALATGPDRIEAPNGRTQ